MIAIKATRRYETFSAVLINASHRIRIQMDPIRRTTIKLTKTILRCYSALWRFVSKVGIEERFWSANLLYIHIGIFRVWTLWNVYSAWGVFLFIPLYV